MSSFFCVTRTLSSCLCLPPAWPGESTVSFTVSCFCCLSMCTLLGRVSKADLSAGLPVVCVREVSNDHCPCKLGRCHFDQSQRLVHQLFAIYTPTITWLSFRSVSLVRRRKRPSLKRVSALTRYFHFSAACKTWNISRQGCLFRMLELTKEASMGWKSGRS